MRVATGAAYGRAVHRARKKMGLPTTRARHRRFRFRKILGPVYMTAEVFSQMRREIQVRASTQFYPSDACMVFATPPGGGSCVAVVRSKCS